MAGAGFRDFTRIAAASPEMWRDVCLNNKEAILNELDGYLDHVNALRAAIANRDEVQLNKQFTQASEQRLAWSKDN
jgi:prephenate dehydrogenase